MNGQFYTYIFATPKGVPFYVGKGKGPRWTFGGNQWARRKARKISSEGGRVRVLIFMASSEQAAFQREVQLIAAYGRRNNGTGVLCNLTDGGEGSAGMKHAEESRLKIAAAVKKSWSNQDHKRSRSGPGNPMFGKPSAMRGRSQSDSARKKMSIAKRAFWSEEENRNRHSETAKRNWANSEIRAKMIAALNFESLKWHANQRVRSKDGRFVKKS